MSTKLGTLTLDLLARVGKFVQPLKAAERQAKDSSKNIGSSLSGIGNLAAKATPLVAGLAGSVAGLAASYVTLDNVVKAQRTFDKQFSGLETATKSLEGAKEVYASLMKFAVETPYGMDQAIEGFTKLVNLGLDPSQRAMRSYGNTASAMGKDLMQLVEAVADASTGEFERLKEFGIKASKEGDQVAFTFQGNTTKIKNSAAEIEEYLIKIGENEFAGAMAKRMDTLDGSFANLEDSWDQLYLSISQAGVGQLVREGVDNASDGVQGLTNIIKSGTIQTGLSGVTRAFSIFGGDAKSEMKGVADSFGLTSDFIVTKWKATIAELNVVGNAWTMMRSWVQKGSVSVAAGWDIISDPFNRRTSNQTKQSNYEEVIASIDAEAKGRLDAVAKGFAEAEKKYKEYMAAQASSLKDTADVQAKYRIAAKDAAETAAKGTEKTNKALEKQKKLLDGLGSGFVSNANLKGLNIKSAESIAGGQVRGYTAEFAQLADSALGDLINRFTAFNDKYHKGTNSKHATGNAFDFTVKDAKQAESAVKILEDVASRYGYSVKILNEYSNPSARATGGHLHVSVLGKKAKQAWNEIQDEVAIIGRGNNEALKLKEDILRKQLAVTEKYYTDEERLATDNAEAVKAINEAYAGDETSRNKYIDLQKKVYAKDLEEFKKSQQQKRDEAWASLNIVYGNLEAARSNAFAKSSMSENQFAFWSAYISQQQGYSDLGENLNNAVASIRDNEYLSQDQKQQELLTLYHEYLEAKKALGLQYAKEEEDLALSQHQAQLSLWGSLLGQAQNTWSQMTQAVKDADGEQSGSFKAMFLMQQAFSIGSALVAAHLASIQVAADATIPFFGAKIAASKAMLAMGYGNAALIAAQTVAGFADGGFTGWGGKYEPAGIVHKGEGVLNQKEIAAIGGPSGFDDLRRAIKGGGYSDGGMVLGAPKVLSSSSNSGWNQYFGLNRKQGAANIQITNNTPAKVDARQDQNGRVYVTIDEVEQWFGAAMANPNSRPSKAVSQNTNAVRRR